MKRQIVEKKRVGSHEQGPAVTDKNAKKEEGICKENHCYSYRTEYISSFYNGPFNSQHIKCNLKKYFGRKLIHFLQLHVIRQSGSKDCK